MRRMPTDHDIDRFIGLMSQAVRHSGLIALEMQKDVVHERKALPRRIGESCRQYEQRAAATSTDYIVQEILGLTALDLFNGKVSIDSEEKSQIGLTSRAPSRRDDRIIIDPIDGTLEYIEGKSNFFICVGWARHGNMQVALVYSPRRDILYFSRPSHAYIVPGFLRNGIARKRALVCESRDTKRIYINRRVPLIVAQQLRSHGFIVINEESEGIGAPDAILKCISGDAICYLAYMRQIRDLLLGAVIGSMRNGYALDWQGHQIIWPAKKRLRFGVFGCVPLPPTVANVIKQYADRHSPNGLKGKSCRKHLSPTQKRAF